MSRPLRGLGAGLHHGGPAARPRATHLPSAGAGFPDGSSLVSRRGSGRRWPRPVWGTWVCVRGAGAAGRQWLFIKRRVHRTRRVPAPAVPVPEAWLRPGPAAWERWGLGSEQLRPTLFPTRGGWWGPRRPRPTPSLGCGIYASRHLVSAGRPGGLRGGDRSLPTERPGRWPRPAPAPEEGCQARGLAVLGPCRAPAPRGAPLWLAPPVPQEEPVPLQRQRLGPGVLRACLGPPRPTPPPQPAFGK